MLMSIYLHRNTGVHAVRMATTSCIDEVLDDGAVDHKVWRRPRCW